jgi:putative transposase
MKQRFTEEQIVKILTRYKNGEKVKELARSVGVSDHTIYIWKKKYGDMTVSEAKRYKAIEAENARLKKIVADLTLDNMMLKEVNSRKW